MSKLHQPIKSPTQYSEDFRHFIAHLRVEALALAILMVALIHNSDASMWWLLIGFPLVDLCILGYIFGPKIGAYSYNIVHNSAIPIILIAIGAIWHVQTISVVGYVWTFHTAIDRLLGYGLKHKHSFNFTHLGKIGKKN